MPLPIYQLHHATMNTTVIRKTNANKRLVAALLASTMFASCAAPCPTPRTSPDRILMVGNSFTFWNGGLWFALQDMLGGKQQGKRVRPSVRGGASLATHAKRPDLLRQIDQGQNDMVILQGDIPESSVDAFEANARFLIARIRASGAEPMLFMTWDYQRLEWLSIQEIIAAHHRAADEADVLLAPVGAAFLRARTQCPELELYDDDREHPSLLGSYLALLILHATVTGSDPRTTESLPRAFRRIDAADADKLRQIAWSIIQDECQRTQSRLLTDA